MFTLTASGITKRFGRRIVLWDVSVSLSQGESAAITGPNGTGKTTLLLTLLRQHRSDSGTVEFRSGDTILDTRGIRHHTALAAPYFQMYGEMTAEENLQFFLSVSGCTTTGKEVNAALERVGLLGRGSDQIRTYSSGMLQRLRLAHVVLKKPAFLFLDEPFVNLDVQGKEMAAALITEMSREAVLIIATNEVEEQKLAQKVVRLA